MDKAHLEKLGLTLEDGESPLPRLSIALREPLINPVNRRPIERVAFTLVGDRLVPVGPPEAVGLPPVLISAMESAGDVEEEVAQGFHEHLLALERRSAELQVLGLNPWVDPETLGLSVEVAEQGMTFTLEADRQGVFRVVKALRAGELLPVSGAHTFELTEFRERSSLVGYLAALFGEQEPVARAHAPESHDRMLRYAELVKAFGQGVVVPAHTALEMLMELQVQGKTYRFAATRVTGRTFRGLLAGAQGKLWAERFELEDFPGVVRLVADLLKVSPRSVKVVGVSAPQE